MLADYELQKAIWLHETDIWSSFNDEVEAVFLDSGIEEMLNQGEVVFGKNADNALRELVKTADNIGYHRDERELVHTAEMENLRHKAAKALALIQATDGSESTVEIVE
ncbi:MAG: hypothetical protein K2Q01_03710 [Rickettsiales bacterium]|nr:hypothetical protein [Rickettsiales bacterium]